MEDTRKTMDRRRFTSLAAALAALSGVAITIGCGGSDSSPTSNSGATGGTGGTGGSASGDKVGTISSNHGHVATITAARLASGGELKLDITGTSNHPHTVDLTAADLTAIAGGQRVSKESSNDAAHTHTVTFN